MEILLQFLQTENSKDTARGLGGRFTLTQKYIQRSKVTETVSHPPTSSLWTKLLDQNKQKPPNSANKVQRHFPNVVVKLAEDFSLEQRPSSVFTPGLFVLGAGNDLVVIIHHDGRDGGVESVTWEEVFSRIQTPVDQAPPRRCSLSGSDLPVCRTHTVVGSKLLIKGKPNDQAFLRGREKLQPNLFCSSSSSTGGPRPQQGCGGTTGGFCKFCRLDWFLVDGWVVKKKP